MERMDDLISRQDTLKAMWRALYEYEDKTEKQFQESKDLDVSEWIMNDRLWVQNGHNLCVDVVASMPSAQPTFDARDTQYNLPIGTDCISRQAAIDALNSKRVSEDNRHMWREYRNDNVDMAIEIMQSLPSTQPEPKRGKWIEYEQEFMLEEPFKTVQKTVRECSICTAKIAGMVGIMNFCPNCGADMREVTE